MLVAEVDDRLLFNQQERVSVHRLIVLTENLDRKAEFAYGTEDIDR